MNGQLRYIYATDNLLLISYCGLIQCPTCMHSWTLFRVGLAAMASIWMSIFTAIQLIIGFTGHETNSISRSSTSKEENFVFPLGMWLVLTQFVIPYDFVNCVILRRPAKSSS